MFIAVISDRSSMILRFTTPQILQSRSDQERRYVEIYTTFVLVLFDWGHPVNKDICRSNMSYSVFVVNCIFFV